ncbi:MAG: septum formation initiator family protein [Actinomycetota bacterium]
MSRGRQPARRSIGRPSRPSTRHEAAEPGRLRVIQGGREDGATHTGPREVEEPRRRCELPAKVKRRRRIVLAMLVLLALGLIAYVLLGPVTRLIESRKNLARVETQLSEEQSRTAVLEERKAWDMTEKFVEWEARKMGYVKPGEIPIIVLDYQEEESAPIETAETPDP